VAKLARDQDVLPRPEQSAFLAAVYDGNLLGRSPTDVTHQKALPGRPVRVARDRADDRADDLHVPHAARKLARLERRGALARDDLEIPLGDVVGLAPQIGEPEVDVELEQLDSRRALGHENSVETPSDGAASAPLACSR